MFKPLFVAVALVQAGCAHPSNFTTAEELRKLTQQPKPARAFEAAAIDVPRFELTGPFGPGAHETATSTGALLVKSAGRFQADGALGCAARELSRFTLENGGNPTSSLKSFVVARCGSTLGHVGTRTLQGPVDDSMSDAELFAQWQPDLAQMIGKLPEQSQAGFALVRLKGKALATLLYATPVATLKPLAAADAEGKVTIEGTLHKAAEKMQTMINQGALGWADCVHDKAVALPAFRFVCPTKKDDASAWVSVGAWEAGRVLGLSAAKVLLFPAGTPVDVYTAPAITTAGPPTVEALVEKLNGVRSQQGLGPLRLARKQSDTASQLAPYYFSELDDADMVDRIALGLMAGWDVEGMLSSGSFDGAWAPQPDSGALVSTMLEDPSSRRDLLDPKVTQIAAGMLVEGNTVGALISTYALMPVVDAIEAPKQLIAQLNEARAKLGKGPVEWLANAGDFYTTAAKALLNNDLTPQQVQKAFMKETLRVTNRPLTALTQTVSALEKVEWADDVLAHPAPQVLVFVGVQREKGEAWGHYVVLTILLGGVAGGPQA